MDSPISRDSYFSEDQDLTKMQLDLESSLKEKGIKETDPLYEKLALDVFQDNKDIQSLIVRHEGTVSKIFQERKNLGITENKIREFQKRILALEKGEATEPSTETKKELKESVSLEFICDFDAQDHNGTMLYRLNSALENQDAVITTRSLLKGSHLQSKTDAVQLRDVTMKSVEKNYDIYTKGELLVFVPKKLGDSDRERTEKLDLDSSKIKKVSLAEAWKETDEKATMQDFQTLFVPEPQHGKYVYIAGHGGAGRTIAGMKIAQYQEFLSWAENQQCQGLLVSSCFSGGASSLQHLPKLSDLEPKKGVAFPVFVRSIGEYTSQGMQKAEKNVPGIFAGFKKLFHSKKGLTVPNIRNIFKEVEEKKKKSPQNLVQVYFPPSADSPGGFRPIGEGGESYSLTYVVHRKHQVEKKGLKVKDQSFVEVSPLVVETPIECKGKNPLFLSMVPGKSIHLLQEVQLDGISPGAYFSRSSVFYGEDTKIGARKAFLFSQIKSEKQTWNQVFFEGNTGDIGFRRGNRYYLWNIDDLGKPSAVSPFEYMLSWKKTVLASLPSPESVRASSGGQESTKDLVQAAESETFWGDQKSTFDRYKKVLNVDYIKTTSSKVYLEQVSSLGLTEAEKMGLVGFVLAHNESLAIELFKQFALSPDSTDEGGIPLLVKASKLNCFAFAKVLIEKNVDVNTEDPLTADTPVGYAIKHEDGKLLELLLNCKGVNLKQKNIEGNRAYTLAYNNLPALKACLAKNPTLDLDVTVMGVDKKKSSLLAKACRSGKNDIVEFLLQSGANPNGKGVGDSPLVISLIKGRRNIVSLLLKYGASPYVKDRNKQTPILEAMRRCSADQVRELLEKPIPEMEEKELRALHLEILFAAVESGEEEKIRLILEKDFIYPETMTASQKVSFQKGLSRLESFGKEGLIRELAKQPEIRGDVYSWTLKEHPDQVLQQMDKSWDLLLLVEKTVLDPQLEEQTRQAIVTKAIELGADINQSKTSLLASAIQAEQVLFASFLIKKGSDLKKAAEAIIKSGNVKLIDLALQRGLLLEPEDSSEPSLLYHIASSDLKDGINRDIFKFLLEQGADVNAQCKSETPFSLVIRSGDKELYDLCLKNDGEKLLKDKNKLPDFIALAAQSGTWDGEEIVQDLVERGGDLNAATTTEYTTPFAAVIQYGSLSFIRWCFEHGAKVSMEESEDKIDLSKAVAKRTSNKEAVEKMLLYKLKKRKE